MRNERIRDRAWPTWALVAGWAALIFMLSAQSDLHFSQDASVDWPLRKAAHMFVFGVLAFLSARALSLSGVRSGLVVAAILVALYAASDEFHQSFVVGRSPLATDVLIDICGGILGVLVFRAMSRRARRT